MRYRLSLSLLLLPALIACEHAPLDPDIDRVDNSTWETVQRRILEPNCAAACHRAGTAFARQSDLILTEDVAYEQLVGAGPANASARGDGLVRVSTEGVAGLDKSYLWEKVNAPNESHFFADHPYYGSLMPMGGDPLTYGELAYIRDWILAGAPDTSEVADRALLANTDRYSSSLFEPLVPEPNTIHLRLGPFDVAPDYERELFYYEVLDEGEDVFIERFEISMRPGSHHFILYTFGADTPSYAMPSGGVYRDIRDANGTPITANMVPMLYHVFFAGTQWPRLDYHFPPGVALRLPRGTGLDLNSHYVNRSEQTLQGEVHVNLHKADPASIQHVAQVMMLNNLDIVLPPGEVTTLSRTYEVHEQRHVFQLFSHAHEHMTEFRVHVVGGARNGELVYLATDWEHPPILELDPPLVLNPGQGLRIETTYDNDTDRTLNFGLLSEDEMMILFGYYY